jgi:hypothetical protein
MDRMVLCWEFVRAGASELSRDKQVAKACQVSAVALERVCVKPLWALCHVTLLSAWFGVGVFVLCRSVVGSRHMRRLMRC